MRTSRKTVCLHPIFLIFADQAKSAQETFKPILIKYFRQVRPELDAATAERLLETLIDSRLSDSDYTVKAIEVRWRHTDKNPLFSTHDSPKYVFSDCFRHCKFNFAT